MDAIDDYVIDRMSANRSRGAAVAISRGGRLAYAKGFTFAEDAYPAVTPSTKFLTASVAKTFTSIAIHKLWSDGYLNRWDYLVDLVPTAAAGWNVTAYIDSIHVSHLLSMAVPFNEKYNGSNERDIWELMGQPGNLPLTKQQVAQYYMNRPDIISDPGPNDLTVDYSNLAYLLLGLVIEEQSPPGSYREYLREDIWAAAGIDLVSDTRRLDVFNWGTSPQDPFPKLPGQTRLHSEESHERERHSRSLRIHRESFHGRCVRCMVCVCDRCRTSIRRAAK
jgi:CubicO group peptidase (beta-lactamase class C family)